MSDLFSMGGGLGTTILGLGAVGLLVMLALGGLALTRRRIPLAAFVVAPLFVCAVGAIAALFSAGSSLSTLSNTAPDQIVAAASQGAYDALQTDWFSRWVGAFLFGVGAWAAGIGAFFAGPWARWTPVAAIAAGVLTLVGAGTISAYANNYGIDGSTLIALLVFSGFGVAFAALRRAEYEEAHRVASMRFASAMCMLLAMSYGSRAVTQGVRMETFGPGGIAHEAESLAAALMMWGDIATPAIAISWIAFSFAILVAFAGLYYELGDVVEKWTLVDVGATLVLLGGLGLVSTVENWRIDDLEAVETSAPAVALFNELSTDLPPALLELEEETIPVRPADGGFGDVLLYKATGPKVEGQPAPEKKWFRVNKWNGTSWEDDNTLLESINDPSLLRPLLVTETATEAAKLAEPLEKWKDKTGLLLMRADEVKAETVVPEELMHLQTTFLPLELDDDKKLDEQLWGIAGETEAYVGAAPWFGPEEDSIPVSYMSAALAETEAPGLQVVITKTSTVKDVIRSCLPTLFDPIIDEDGIYAEVVDVEPAEAWCRISVGTYDEVVKEAMEAREPLETDRVSASIGAIPAVAAKAIGADHIKARLPYELAAIEHCVNTAEEEGEEVVGVMSLTLSVSRRGRISTKLNERSANENDMVWRCVRGRMEYVRFEVDEEAWPEPGDEEASAPPPQEIPMTLTVREQAS